MRYLSSPVRAWSYSRWALYDQCPYAFKAKHIDKVQEKQSPAMARGDAIHKKAAAYIDGKIDAAQIPPELANFKQLMGEMRYMPSDARFVEQQWGFSKNWRPCGWFGDTTWLRIVVDAGVVYPDCTADIIDHKTGKRYDTNRDQLELNALGVMCRFPQVSHVTTRLWYLDEPGTDNEAIEEFTANNRTETIAKWESRVAPMFEDTVFASRPGDHCRRCSFARSKGGTCRFG